MKESHMSVQFIKTGKLLINGLCSHNGLFALVCPAFARFSTSTVTPFGRSRPAADASREVEERWLLYGL